MATFSSAALAFVEALRPEDSVMVLSFDSYIYLDAAFTRDRAALRRAILKTDTGAGTRLYDALDVVITECLSRVEGRKAIVLFTDGIDTHSWLARFGNYRNRVEESDALLYAVQFDVTAGRPASQYLKGLSENSGGRLFAASTISSLAESFAGVSEELQHQYTICYYPSAQNKRCRLSPHPRYGRQAGREDPRPNGISQSSPAQRRSIERNRLPRDFAHIPHVALFRELGQ